MTLNGFAKAATLAIIAVLFFMAPARAVSFGVQAGLDSSTRKLIERMPAKIREEIVKTLEQSLPLVDKSVLLYLSEVDRIISTSIGQLDCAIDGDVKDITEGVSWALYPLKRRPRPVLDLDTTVAKTLGNLDRDTRPIRYLLTYAQLLDDTRRTWCSVRGTPAAEQEIERIQVILWKKYRLWSRAAETDCQDARTCALAVKLQVIAGTASADPRDTSPPKAASRLAAIDVPDYPMFAGFDLDRYEDAIDDAQRVGDEVRLYEAARLRSAEQHLASATAAVETYQRTLRSSSAAGQHARRSRDVRGIIDNVHGMGQIAVLAREPAELAANTHASTAPNVQALLVRATALDNERQAVVSALQERFNRLRAREMFPLGLGFSTRTGGF